MTRHETTRQNAWGSTARLAALAGAIALFSLVASAQTAGDTVVDTGQVGCSEGSRSAACPAAAFAYSPPSPVAGASVSFTDTSTGSPTSWSWSFGDGATSALRHPSHAYARAGTFTVTLNVTNAAGSSTTSRAVTVGASGGGQPGPAFNMAQTLSDGAQRTTLAFAGLAMMTGNLEAQSFFPPGKVADYTGFQYLRDNDPDGMGHNTSFLTRVANNVIYVLNDSQFNQLKTLATAQLAQINLYGYKRFPLMKAFRRLIDADLPSGSAGLDLDAVRQASRELYVLDGQISFDRALLYATVLSSLNATQKAHLDAMKGKGWKSWPDITNDQIKSKMQGLPQGTAVAVMTYASDLFSWYAGSVEADVYFCPERHGTYYGSFYMKDAPAIGHEGYSINEQLTATAGAALSDSSKGYVTAEQAARISSLVDTQRDNLYASATASIVQTRTEIATLLRGLLITTASSDAIKARVLELSARYGELDGENNHAYATVFAEVYKSLTSDQKTRLAALRKSILSGTYADGTPFDFTLCTTPYLYSSPIPDLAVLAPYLDNTDALFYAGATTTLTLSPSALSFAGTNSGGTLSALTAAQTVTVTVSGAGSTSWTASASQPWVQILGGSGTGTGSFTLGIINPGNVLGTLAKASATITVAAPGAGNSPQTVAVDLTLHQASASAAPFGQVDTPVQNAAGIVGTIGVTGWALDDVGVTGVQIYRNCLPFENQANCRAVVGANLVYVGDAVFVAGARPDVEAAFPAMPQANRAGWGYLLLTNMLPDVTGGQGYGGQGPLTLYAVATDGEGNATLLGRSQYDHTPTTITMANASIAKPFGAIDTPGQGETVSGTVANFGWALTPDSDRSAGAGDILIPTDGSSMVVFIDGIAAGNVAYNQCRGTVGNLVPADVYCNDDVANVFGHAAPHPTFTLRTGNPTRYRNLDAGRAAIGAYVLDTTTLPNGLHTIAWSVTDSAGRLDGIGSRYFTVMNNGAGAAPATVATADVTPASSLVARGLKPARGDSAGEREVTGRTGFDTGAPYEVISADDSGVRHVRLPELGRVELQLGPVEGGSVEANGTLRELPPGSKLDCATGQFTWAPGVAYVGTYRLTFLRSDGAPAQMPFDITIAPATSPGEAEIRMHVDSPRAGDAFSGAFAVEGWALDPRAAIGSGIGAVHVWARRTDLPGAEATFLGAAALGGQRPDVASAFGPQFDRTGFGLTSPGLAPGQYEVTAYAWNRRTTRWEDARTVRVTVR